jgi:hypothetical protein
LSEIERSVTLLWIVGAFLLFMAVILSVHAVDAHAEARYGYAPFAIPNVLFMLIPNGLLLLAVRAGGEQTQVLVTLAGAALLGMLLLIRVKTNGWIALFAAPMLLLCAPVLVLSVLFRSLARPGDHGDG